MPKHWQTTANNVSVEVGETVADLANQLALKNTATPTTTYAVSAPVFVSATEATMTCATIANTVTSVTWTWTPTTGTPVTGTFAGETTAPTISSVTNVNGDQVVVAFSEKVGETNAETIGNYTLQNRSTGTTRALTGKRKKGHTFTSRENWGSFSLRHSEACGSQPVMHPTRVTNCR